MVSDLEVQRAHPPQLATLQLEISRMHDCDDDRVFISYHMGLILWERVFTKPIAYSVYVAIPNTRVEMIVPPTANISMLAKFLKNAFCLRLSPAA